MTSRFHSNLPTNILRGITPTATLWDGTIGFAYLDDGGVFTDDTTDANSAAANDVPLMPAVPVLNDAFYFGEGFATSGTWNALKINLGTAGVGGTIAWEYYNGAAWVALTVTDGTNGFTTAGTNYVTWTIPADMGHVAVNGQDRYWVRARVLTAFAPIPLATQIWVGKYPTTLTNATDGNVSSVADTGTKVISVAENTGYITVDFGTIKTVLITAKIGVYSSAGTSDVYVEESDDNTNWRNTSNSILSVATATELINWTHEKLLSARYVRFRCRNSAAATCNYKFYEIIAHEMGL